MKTFAEQFGTNQEAQLKALLSLAKNHDKFQVHSSYGFKRTIPALAGVLQKALESGPIKAETMIDLAEGMDRVVARLEECLLVMTDLVGGKAQMDKLRFEEKPYEGTKRFCSRYGQAWQN